MLHTNATRTLTFGAKRNGKDACRCAGYADRSCRCLPALEPTLVASMDGRPCTEQPELAGRGSGGTGDRNHRAIKAGKWGRMCHRSSWQRIDRSSEVPSAGSGPSGPPNTALGTWRPGSKEEDAKEKDAPTTTAPKTGLT